MVGDYLSRLEIQLLTQYAVQISTNFELLDIWGAGRVWKQIYHCEGYVV